LEYDFQLDYLVLKNLPFEQKESLKKQSINPELALLFEKDEEIKKKKKKEKKVKKGRVEQMLEDRKDEMRFLQAETEVIVQTVKQLLIDHAQHLNSAKKRDIQDNLDRLSRLRHSSSINHLEQIMKRIFKKLRSDNLFIFTEENILEVEQSQKEIKRVVRKLELELKKGLSKVQVGDLEKLTKVFQAGVVSKVLVTVYWGFVFLLVMLLSFWVLHGVKFFFGKDIEKINFYFSSNSLWFLTGMSAIVVGFFAFDVFARTKPLTLAKRIILYGIGFGVLAVFTLQFPALFFWTR